MQSTPETSSFDPHAQLRSLYLELLKSQDRFDEFKHILSLYPGDREQAEQVESPEAARVREELNAKIREWLRGDFAGLSSTQVVLWRAIVVEERFNVALSPWKESNLY
jgi:hypothetical protein